MIEGTDLVTTIEHIWSETLNLREKTNLTALASILDSLLAAPMICFTTKAGGPTARPIVSYAGDEVLPGTSLADVLFEEFGIEISDDTIVLIDPTDISDANGLSSQELGQELGQVLVELSGLNRGESLKTETLNESDIVRQHFWPKERRTLMNLVQ